MRQERRADSRLIHHAFWASDFGAAVTSAFLTGGNLVTDGAGTANMCMPRDAKLRTIGIHALCAVVNVAGNWTMRIRDNEGAVDRATISFACAASPGSKTAGPLSADFVLLAGNTYNVQCDGPSRNIFICRAIVEWEVL